MSLISFSRNSKTTCHRPCCNSQDFWLFMSAWPCLTSWLQRAQRDISSKTIDYTGFHFWQRVEAQGLVSLRPELFSSLQCNVLLLSIWSQGQIEWTPQLCLHVQETPCTWHNMAQPGFSNSCSSIEANGDCCINSNMNWFVNLNKLKLDLESSDDDPIKIHNLPIFIEPNKISLSTWLLNLCCFYLLTLWDIDIFKLYDS